MNAARSLSAQDRTRQILEDLEAVRENLLALSDDIWDSIDRQDLTAFDEGVQFMRTYLQKMTGFDQLATEISAMIQEYTSIRLEAQEETGLDDRESNERIIQELNREEPHSVDEDFTYKRPHGFILCRQGASSITTWQRVYELVCQQLLRRDPQRMRSLVEHSDFISNRGHRSFTHDRASLRKALEIEDGLYAESNLSADGIRDMIRQLLTAFELPKEEMKIFLREDRDAARGGSDPV